MKTYSMGMPGAGLRCGRGCGGGVVEGAGSRYRKDGPNRGRSMQRATDRPRVRKGLIVSGAVAIVAALVLAAVLYRAEPKEVDPAYGMRLLSQVQAALAHPGAAGACRPDEWFPDEPRIRAKILAADRRWFILFRPADEFERRADQGDRDLVILLRRHHDDLPLSVGITLEDGECGRFGAAQWEY